MSSVLLFRGLLVGRRNEHLFFQAEIATFCSGCVWLCSSQNVQLDSELLLPVFQTPNVFGQLGRVPVLTVSERSNRKFVPVGTIPSNQTSIFFLSDKCELTAGSSCQFTFVG